MRSRWHRGDDARMRRATTRPPVTEFGGRSTARLTRVSGWCFDHPVAAIALWLVGLVAVFGASGTVGPAFSATADVPDSDSADGFGIYSDGNAHVNGTLSKLAGSFKIDHPLDPKHKWLSHSFVESPDMMNVYNGNVTLDGAGSATVDLPSYFDALNRDYRYQLTPIGAAAPDLHVASEIKDNSFTIAGGPANGTVSWQVTGIRKDAYAEEHPIVVEEDKGADASGKRSFVPKGGSRAASADQALRPTAVKVPHHPRLAEITPRIKHTP